jgi:hypothetical protein
MDGHTKRMKVLIQERNSASSSLRMGQNKTSFLQEEAIRTRPSFNLKHPEVQGYS